MGTTPGQTVSHATTEIEKHVHGHFLAQQNSTTTSITTTMFENWYHDDPTAWLPDSLDMTPTIALHRVFVYTSYAEWTWTATANTSTAFQLTTPVNKYWGEYDLTIVLKMRHTEPRWAYTHSHVRAWEILSHIKGSSCYSKCFPLYQYPYGSSYIHPFISLNLTAFLTLNFPLWYKLSHIKGYGDYLI